MKDERHREINGGGNGEGEGEIERREISVQLLLLRHLTLKMLLVPRL